ncbi:MAG: hypothetical protein Q8L22_11535 [Reyranella sp.]|nr:hypothetical protein [Reyranella sp.]
MAEFSKNMQRALDAVRVLSPEQQDLLAAELMEHARLLTLPPTRLSPGERAELEAALVAARRGEFAGDAEVNAMYAKHGL